MINIKEKKRFNAKSARAMYTVAFILAICTILYYGAVCVVGFIDEKSVYDEAMEVYHLDEDKDHEVDRYKNVDAARNKYIFAAAEYAGVTVLCLLILAAGIIGFTRKCFPYVFGGLALILLPVMALMQSVTKMTELGMLGMEEGDIGGALLGILKYVFCGACVILTILALRNESLKSDE